MAKPTIPTLPKRGWFQIGDKGEQVKNMQNCLIYLGFSCGKDGADGQFGKNTKNAVLKFQKKYKLSEDGGWGKECNKKAKALIYPPEKTWADKAVDWAKKIAADNSYHYVKWSSDKKTHECPICHKHPKGKYHGWNCIGFAFACWHHGGGLKSKCNCGVIANEEWEKILKAKADTEADKIASKCVGIPVKVVRNNGKAIPQSKLKKGDICSYFINGNHYQHTFFYMGNGKLADSTSGRSDNIKAGVSFSGAYKNDTKVAIRPK